MTAALRQDRVRVVVADDDPAYLGPLVGLLSTRADIEVVAAVHEGAAAVHAIDASGDPPVDAVLLDVEMPGLGGVDAAAAIRRSHPDIAIVMLTGWGYAQVLDQALAAGATGCLDKSLTADEIAEAIVATTKGATVLSRRAADVAARHSRDRISRREANTSFIEAVTALPPGLRPVYELVTQGLSNRQVAMRLHLSENTVNTYVTRILKATGSSSRTELTIRCLTSRL
ncbi:MAG: response regulator transcription factor [Actinomyces sp.]|jgi:DNA-binding NarL/FixJ family response regulator|nr:response regulator transcription factor [Actinomyces sp.]MCI1642068.1 response regulator transcription factor [Actinomyces sp.]MCI1661490.1 response regulator transcription factor [Actinomyces sp.]MCI1690846.1 response regulator transcription factor [Actinomyces sp.]MCI1788183.1 response regulator transcription factor [Actinomyces sp.]MCI1830086.1 response regulator transcription factor [Actinomyces sp.]